MAERTKQTGIVRRITDHLELRLFRSDSFERRTRNRNNLLKVLNRDYSIKRLQKEFANAQQIDMPTINGIHLKFSQDSRYDHISLDLPAQGFIPEPISDEPESQKNWGHYFDAHFLLQEAAAELFTEPQTRKFSVLEFYLKDSEVFSLSPFYDISPTITDLLAFTNSKLYLERKAKKGQWTRAQWVLNIGRVETNE